MLKRIIGLLICFSMMCMLFTACGKEQTVEETTEDYYSDETLDFATLAPTEPPTTKQQAISLNVNNIEKYFKVSCRYSSTNSTNGDDEKYCTLSVIGRVTSKVSMKKINNVSVTLGLKVDDDKGSYGDHKYEEELTVNVNSKTGAGVDEFSSTSTLLETSYYPVFTLDEYYIKSVTGSIVLD